MTLQFDIIIPVSYSDSLFLRKSLPYIRKNIINAQNIFVISCAQNETAIKEITSQISRCYFVDEDMLLENLSFSIVDAAVKTKYPQGMRTGWYFQQFLKMGFAKSSYSQEYYLSWDADTIPINKLSFFDAENHPLYVPKKEYNKPYFDTIRTLLGLEKWQNYSFIAEHMMFKSSVMRELLKDIEQSSNVGNSWIEKIINATDYDSAKRPEMFSEFETYGTYVTSKYPDLYRIRHINSFREGGLIRGRFITDEILKKMMFDLDTVSFELADTPAFPWNIAHKLYKMYLVISERKRK